MFGELFFASLLPAFLVTISIYICLNFLGLADMTCDGSFSLGACAVVTLFGYGIHDLYGLFIVFILGCCAGFMTAFMINKIKINGLLASIISMTALHSINYLVLQSKSSVTFDPKNMIFSSLDNVLIVVVALILLITMILRSEYGLILKVNASNPNVTKSININKKIISYFAIILTNGMFAVAGALFIAHKTTVVPMVGGGELIGGLIALIIGENLMKTNNFVRGVIACIIGTVIYRIILEVVTHEQALSIDPAMQSLITASMIVLLFALKDFKLISGKAYAKVFKK